MTDHKTIDDGGAAFPGSEKAWADGEDVLLRHKGMSLRQWYAGMALQGLIAGKGFEGAMASTVPDNVVNRIAGSAFEFADAMIAAEGKLP